MLLVYIGMTVATAEFTMSGQKNQAASRAVLGYVFCLVFIGIIILSSFIALFSCIAHAITWPIMLWHIVRFSEGPVVLASINDYITQLSWSNCSLTIRVPRELLSSSGSAVWPAFSINSSTQSVLRMYLGDTTSVMQYFLRSRWYSFSSCSRKPLVEV